jgi:uncharacterized membrane protein
MLNKLFEIIKVILDDALFALFASITTAMLRPQDTRLKTIQVAVATTILGTLIGKSIENVAYIATFKYAIVTIIGLYGKELYDYLWTKLRNPLAFWKELKGKD